MKQRLIEEREDTIRNYAADMSQAKEEGREEGLAECKIEVARNFLKRE